MVNRYPGICYYCDGRVPANGGNLFKVAGRWVVAHLACLASGGSVVNTYAFSGGETFIRNKKGTCEDAPCCGCCTI